MNQQVINGRQMAWLLVTFMSTSNLFFTPQKLSQIAGTDSLFLYIFPLLFAFMICYLLYRLARIFPGSNLFEINYKLAGKWGGGIINGFILLQIFFLFTRNIRSLTSFLNSTLLLQTPEWVIIFLFVLLLIYYGRSGLEVTARVNDLVFPLIFLLVIILPILLINEFALDRLEPMMVHSSSRMASGSLLVMGWFTNIITIGAFMNTVSKPKQLYTSIRHGLCLAIFMITIFLATSLCVFGDSITARQIYPAYALASQINITDFLDRFEIFLFFIYFPSVVISSVFLFIAMLIGLSVMWKVQDYRPYSISVGLLLVLCVLLAFHGGAELKLFSFYGFPGYALISQAVILLLIYLLSRRRRFRQIMKDSRLQEEREKSENDENANKSEESSDSDSSTPRRKRRSPSFWMRFTNLILVLAIIFLVLGFAFAKDFWIIGIICSIVYAICIVSLVVTSFMEHRSLSRNKAN